MLEFHCIQYCVVTITTVKVRMFKKRSGNRPRLQKRSTVFGVERVSLAIVNRSRPAAVLKYFTTVADEQRIVMRYS